MTEWKLGLIGGSGLYNIDGVKGGVWQEMETPWGNPSDAIFTGSLNGVEIAFLPRHGRDHATGPSQLNFRANIYALKALGCTDVLSLSACGSLKEELAPGSFVVVDQFIDRTFAREKSFFGEGCVAHVSMADPVCLRLAALAAEAGRKAGAEVHEGGTYLVMEGPQFSSRAESELYRQWGCSVIGMTNMPEAKLAREAELPYATIAMVTDYDCWHDGHEAVSVDQVIAFLKGNADRARALVQALTQALAGLPRTPSPQNIETVLDLALITPPHARNRELLSKLDAILKRQTD
jgi:5'-methylthioadenosine phosphorylase